MESSRKRIIGLSDEKRERVALQGRLLSFAGVLNLIALAAVIYIGWIIRFQGGFFSFGIGGGVFLTVGLLGMNGILLGWLWREKRSGNELDIRTDCDPLTGALNRQGFLEFLEDEIRRAGRYRYPLSLCLLDLDGFKSLNKNFGRYRGDEVLQNFSKLVRRAIRFSDSFSRYGSDEFAVILPHTDIVRAQKFAERTLVQALERMDHSFCAGITTFRPGEGRIQLLERAVLALRNAKREGQKRIRCVLADEESQTAFSL